MKIGVGHIWFAAAFAVVFIGVTIFLYLKDRKIHSTHYRGKGWVFLGIALAIAVLILLKNWVLKA